MMKNPQAIYLRVTNWEPAMHDEIELISDGDEIELISDGDGLAIIGSQTAVEQFLVSQGLESKDLGLPRLSSGLSAASGAAQAGSELSANFGRWVKLTEQSASDLKAFGAMKGSSSEVSRAVVMNKGKIKGIAEFVKTTPTTALTNPALLAGAAGLMAQLAMQQAIDEITDYLAVIDAKVDDVLRAQKDASLAAMIGVDFAIQEALTIRDEVGRVSEITWSKIQSTPLVIGQTQAYALRQLDALAEKMESTSKVGDLAKTSKNAESKALEWLAVLARCFQLQDAIAVIELDRVLDASPDELERHRVALRRARRNRLEMISRTTENLLERMDAAAAGANAKVLLHPTSARAVVHSSNHVATDVLVFQERIGIEQSRESLEARRWRDAAGDARDKAIDTGTDGVEAAKRIGIGATNWAKSASDKVSAEIADRVRGRRDDDDKLDDEVPWLLESSENDRE